MLAYLAPSLNNFLTSAATVFALSVIVHAIMVPLFMLIHRLLTRMTGMDIG